MFFLGVSLVFHVCSWFFLRFPWFFQCFHPQNPPLLFCCCPVGLPVARNRLLKYCLIGSLLDFSEFSRKTFRKINRRWRSRRLRQPVPRGCAVSRPRPQLACQHLQLLGLQDLAHGRLVQIGGVLVGGRGGHAEELAARLRHGAVAGFTVGA